MTCEKSRKDISDAETKALSDYSKQLIDHIRQREGDILRLLVTLGGVLTLYGLAIDRSNAFGFLVIGDKLQKFNPLVLLGATVIVQMIFTWVGCFILATSYNYRSLQCVFARIQYTLAVLDYKPDKWAPWDKDTKKSSNKKEKGGSERLVFDFVPEMQRVHIYATICFNFALTISTALILWMNMHDFRSVFPALTFVISVLLLYYTQNRYLEKYKELDFIHDEDIIKRKEEDE